MQKLLYLTALLLLSLSISACSKLQPREAVEQMIEEVNQASKEGSLEKFNKVYEKYYDYLKELDPEQQWEFVQLSTSIQPSETTVNFVTEHLQEIVKLEYLVKMGELSQSIYMKNVEKVNPPALKPIEIQENTDVEK